MLDVALVEDVEGLEAVGFAVGGGPVGPGGAVDGGEGGEGEEGDGWGEDEGGEGGGEGGGEEEEEEEDGEHGCESGWGRELVLERDGSKWIADAKDAWGGVQGCEVGFMGNGSGAGSWRCGGGVAGIGLLVVRSDGWRRVKW